jgi:hypothetical protein
VAEAWAASAAAASAAIAADVAADERNAQLDCLRRIVAEMDKADTTGMTQAERGMIG